MPSIQLFHRLLTAPLEEGGCDGLTPVLSKLFTAALQGIVKSLDADERLIRVDGRFSPNLRFGDDVVFSSNSTAEAETTLAELYEGGKANKTANQPEEDTVH